MSRSIHGWRWALAAFGAALIVLPATAPAAAADGLPVVNLDTTETGITSPDGSTRYYAASHGDGTEVLAVDLEAEAGKRLTMDRLVLNGTLAVPGVAWDGTTSGISADGRSLALIEPRVSFPRKDTRLVVIDTERMKRTAVVDLDGDFSFDSISPDGRTLYLVHYIAKNDPTKYEVRAYDLERERLLPDPIIDSRTAPIVMRGYPITRAVSADGVWAYTLYDGAGKTPFVHALNTAEGSALCIDVDALGDARNLYDLELLPSPDGSTLTIADRHGATVASIETGSWEVTEPGDEAAAAPADAGGGDGLPWAGLAAIAAGVALIGGGFVVRRRRRGGNDPESEMPLDPELESPPAAGEQAERVPQ